MKEIKTKNTQTGLEIAVIGMAGRFPGANDIDTLWSNLEKGVESITFFTDEELLDAGIEAETLNQPGYVKAKGYVEDTHYFDSYFFNYNPIEAGTMDPQIRIFHECTWHALENAGYDPKTYNGLIGLYAGYNPNISWIVSNFLKMKSAAELFEVQLLNGNHFTSIISYKLNLKGPVMSINTACSTSLAAIHTAGRALLTGETDIAVAGGITLSFPAKTGYFYQEGMVMSPDGHCRAFDEKANGTASGNGVGLVVLKRLVKAIKDGDYIYAVMKGSAINNDGDRKPGYTAPSVEAQTEVIRSAHKLADVSPDTITYIETHGTGTPLGDPIEFLALKKAFGNTAKKQFCRLGFIKANIGHLDAASGVAGFIKTVLALHHRIIPPAVNFDTPNTKLDIENSPFYINKTPENWNTDETPRRAGVSSFGIGGTNAHAVLEEYPVPTGTPAAPGITSRLILLSAKTQPALDTMTKNLAEFFKQNPGVNFDDAAYTLQVGRSAFNYRKMLLCRDNNGAIEGLLSTEPGKARGNIAETGERPVVFMFPGLGTQYVGMGLELYRVEPLFREEMDRCFTILKSLGLDIKEILYPSSMYPSSMYSSSMYSSSMATNHPEGAINQLEIAQAAVFIFQYALVQLLMKWGIKPHSMIGYSFGEYVAACIAGVFSLEEALTLVTRRGKLINTVPAGAMTGVPINKETAQTLLNERLAIAIDNGDSCIIAGPIDAIDAFEKQMREKRYICMRLQATHAIHTPMMEPILYKFESQVATLTLNKPKIPFISNVTGKWMNPEDAVNPRYWVTHLRETVRFSEGLKELVNMENAVFVEIGPGVVLSTLTYQYISKALNHAVVNLVRAPDQEIPDTDYLYRKIGTLWLYGIPIDWAGFNAGEKRKRIPLPPYPFDKRPYNTESQVHKWLSENRESGVKFELPTPSPSEPPFIPHNREETKTPYVAPRNKAEQILGQIWEELLGISPIGIHDNLLDMGVTSLKGVTFVNRFKEQLGEMIHITAIFDAPTIAELAEYFKKHYPISFAGIMGDQSLEPMAKALPKEKVTMEKIMRFRRNLGIIPDPVDLETPKNPRAVFVISPPRTGSTLLRVMLGGHPGLFSPPELNLLFYNTLRERKERLTGAAASHLQGTIRAIMEIKKCTVEEAREIMEQLENRDMSVKEFYRLLQSWIGDQLLVDKSPSYSEDIDVLRRMELYFRDPLYIHLTRHPYGMIHSYAEARMDLLAGANVLEDISLTREELAEVIYTESVTNILEFLKSVPEGRRLTVRFEDIVSTPDAVSRSICRFLNIEYHPEMSQPYKEKKKRMTDGVYSEGQMIGDPKFHTHKNIDPGAAENWKQIYKEDFMGEPTLEIAKTLGYSLINEPKEETREKISDHLMMLSKAPEGGENLFFIHERTGMIGPYIEFCKHLALLDNHYDCWGILPDKLKNNAPQNWTIEGVATRYIEKMKLAQPRGPYSLFTWSFGGHIAFEMVRQMEEQGDTVARLIFADCTGPLGRLDEDVRPFTIETEKNYLKGFFAGHVTWKKIEKMWDINHIWPFIVDLLKFSNPNTNETKRTLNQFTGNIIPDSEGLSIEAYIVHLNLDRTFKNAGARYFPPGKIQTPIHYLKAKGSDLNKTDHWRDYCGTPMIYHEVEGDHHSIFQPPDVVEFTRVVDGILKKTR